jgi:hypothetical protein
LVWEDGDGVSILLHATVAPLLHAMAAVWLLSSTRRQLRTGTALGIARAAVARR